MKSPARYRTPPPKSEDDGSDDDRLRPLWLGGFVALAVATPILPTETVDTGGSVLVVMLLWWLLLAAWCLSGVARARLDVKAGPVVWAWGVFLVCHALSGLVMAWQGNPRSTLNMVWLWISFGIAFFLARQLIATAGEQRAFVAVMISLAVSFSVLGFFQYFYELPATRAEYERDPDRVLRDAGIDAPPGTPQRKLFEDRLYSTEPLATFALTNSLAGFLLPWLVVASSIAISSWRRSWPLVRRFTGAAAVVLVAGCLILTKSRTAWLATGLAVALAVLYGRRSGWRPDWRWLAAAAGVAVILSLVAIVVGGLDWLVVLETSKSFLYRVQYWRATAALIGDYPWLGCGPGNFQQYYTAYKLPEASETIAEPHNFLLEIWATAGSVAWLAFLAIFGAAIWETRSRSDCPERARNSEQGGSCRAIYWGALAGALLGYVLCSWLEGYAPSAGWAVLGLPVAAVLLLGLHAWVVEGELSSLAVAIALAAILVNLLAAGGIGFASVSLTVWLLLALVTHRDEDSQLFRSTTWRLGRGGAAILKVGAVVGLAVFHQTTFSPVTTAETLLVQGNARRMLGQPLPALAAFSAAAEADPFSPVPWQQLAETAHGVWLQTGSESHRQQFVDASSQQLRRNQRSSHDQMVTGHRWLLAWRRFNQPEYLQQAIYHYEFAVALYPNYNLGRAQLAWAMYLAGDREALRERDEALRLDALNPHAEQKLASQRIVDPAAAPERSAEQLLGEIRMVETDSRAE